VILPTTTEFCLKLNLYYLILASLKCKYFHVNKGNRKRFDVRVKALTVLDAHSIRIMKRMSECRINERVWKRHNAYGRSSISRICWLRKRGELRIEEGRI
jgi:hypothetical protein